MADGATNEPVVFPPVDKVPPVDSPQVHQWLSGCSRDPTEYTQPGNPPMYPSKVPDGVCNWLCDGCSADDVVDCPVKNE